MPADSSSSGDPFTQFWTDFWSRMAPGGMAGPGAAPPEWIQQARRTFFDAMAASADQFMRSETFLKSMKQTMDNSLAWQKMLNQYLQKGMAGMPVPERSDTDEVIQLIRAMEERLSSKLSDVSQRVEKLEKSGDANRGRSGK